MYWSNAFCSITQGLNPNNTYVAVITGKYEKSHHLILTSIHTPTVLRLSDFVSCSQSLFIEVDFTPEGRTLSYIYCTQRDNKTLIVVNVIY